MEKRKLLPIVGVAIFIWLIYNIDTTAVMKTLLKTDVAYFAVAFALVVPIVLLKSLKWKLIVDSYVKGFSLRSSTKSWMIGFLFGIVTPGRLGELVRSYYLKKSTLLSYGKSITTIFADRVIDIAVLFTLSIFGIIALIGISGSFSGFVLYIILFFVAFILAVFMLTKKKIASLMLSPVNRSLVPPKYRSVTGKLFNDFYAGMKDIKAKRMLYSGILCLLAWVISIVQFQLVSISLGIHIDTLFVAAVFPLVVLTDALPFSFSGIGTRELALVAFLSIKAVPAESAISISLLFFLMNYVSVALAAVPMWLKDPLRTPLNDS